MIFSSRALVLLYMCQKVTIMRIIITFLGLFPKLTEYQHQDSIYKGEVLYPLNKNG
jgi:hypothetical protein